MVYDDDTGKPPHHRIRSIDRQIRGDREISNATWELVTSLAEAHPGWNEEDIHDEIRQTRHDITLDEIYAILARLRRR
jgi:Fe2+ or Zn2+ uptake regulation protein